MAARAAEVHPHATRLMLVVADGCRVGVALDSVSGVYELRLAEGCATARLPDGSAVPCVAWDEVTGVSPRPRERDGGHVVVLRTERGPVGLVADACLGVRDVPLAQAPLRTTLVDRLGEPLCLVVPIDRRPHFVLDPRALSSALDARGREGTAALAHEAGQTA